MRGLRLWLGGAVALLSGFPLLAQASGSSGDFLGLQRRLVELYQEHHRAVVRVNAAREQQGEDGQPKVALRVGTGFFISREGHVLTNASVAYAPDRVWVDYLGTSYAAERLGEDVLTNLSLLRVLEVPPEIDFIPLSDSPELPATGSMVVRLSAPLEFGPSPSLGLVAGSESIFGNRNFPCAYIRATLFGGPGEGGAPVLDLNGQLIGVAVASLPEIQSSYLVPARAALRVRDDLLFSGAVRHGWIGFEIQERRTVAEGTRVLLREVLPETPAAEVGLQVGDVLVSLGNQPVRNLNELRNAMFYVRPGQFVAVRVQRGDQTLEFNVRARQRPPSEPLDRPEPAPAPLPDPRAPAQPPATPEPVPEGATTVPPVSPEPPPPPVHDPNESAPVERPPRR